MPSLCLAYYCSGHGYGHATRVSAFASHLLRLPEDRRPMVVIVSSAPKHVFSDSIARGAQYRYATIDPVIVQPLAYRVDRRKSVDVLKDFLDRKEDILKLESQWLRDARVNCVLSDAAFLGCLAAKIVGIPSILITNFTFDSVYNYLATTFIDATDDKGHRLVPNAHPSGKVLPDFPIPMIELDPLVDQIHAGYRCADLLFRLPGHIPIPSFFAFPRLPSPDWVDLLTQRFRPDVVHHLNADPSECELLPNLLPNCSSKSRHHATKRKAFQAPLIVRPPSDPAVYSLQGRSRFLTRIGIPSAYHDHTQTKILVVSFGGQMIRKPRSARSSPIPSRATSPEPISNGLTLQNGSRVKAVNGVNGISLHRLHIDLDMKQHLRPEPKRLTTPEHIWIPGAPPTSKRAISPTSPTFSPSSRLPQFNMIPPTPRPDIADQVALNGHTESTDGVEEEEPSMLPDSSWIAIVCGVSKEQWSEDDSDLPERFFVAPRDVYMPDLTGISDVLLGKLGYGTVSECVDACTPFVYVSRPLFIEEHGLRLLLDQEGVGVELSREAYEAGDWASAVQEAYEKGKSAKQHIRLNGWSDEREQEGGQMAERVIAWVEQFWDESAERSGCPS